MVCFLCFGDGLDWLRVDIEFYLGIRIVILVVFLGFRFLGCLGLFCLLCGE